MVMSSFGRRHLPMSHPIARAVYPLEARAFHLFARLAYARALRDIDAAIPFRKVAGTIGARHAQLARDLAASRLDESYVGASEIATHSQRER